MTALGYARSVPGSGFELGLAASVGDEPKSYSVKLNLAPSSFLALSTEAAKEAS